MSTQDSQSKTSKTPLFAQMGGNLIGVGFLALAALFLFRNPTPAIPSAATPEFDRAAIEPIPMRTILGDPPIVKIGGFEQRCDECHRLFTTPSNRDLHRQQTQHAEITLKHGMNDECLNCHDIAERERLRLHNGSTVPFTEVALLCAQCHGPVYRDWDRGVHGKTVGAWNPELGEQIRYTCTQCHDPHAPTYPALKPLPGPHTLRLGDTHTPVHEAIGIERNVLLRWTRQAQQRAHDDNHIEPDDEGHEP